MSCTGESGHPRYRDGDPEDQMFTDGELLYRRYRMEHFQNQQLLPSAFKFPRQSFNRQKYSTPQDVLHADCCEGKRLPDGWGVLECSATDLPMPISGYDGRTFQFQPVHTPLECCYAHTEVCCKVGDELVDNPSPKVKEIFRVRLAQRMTVRIDAGG
jgi:hypothetical protein